MIVSEFLPQRPAYIYKPIKSKDIVGACDFLLNDKKSIGILAEVGTRGDISNEQAVFLNFKLRDFVSQKNLLKAYHSNFAISVALARQKIAGNITTDKQAFEFAEDKYFQQPDSASGFVYDETSNTRPATVGDIILIARDIEANFDLMIRLRDYTSRQLTYGSRPDFELENESNDSDLRVSLMEWHDLWDYPSRYYTEKYGLLNRKVLTSTSLRLVNCVHFYDMFNDEYKEFYPNFRDLDDPNISEYLLEQSGRMSVGDIRGGDYV